MTIWLFCPLRFAQSHTRAITVLVDELDAGPFYRRFLLGRNSSLFILGSFRKIALPTLRVVPFIVIVGKANAAISTWF